MMKAVILANGDFPTHPTPRSILENATTRVCCDGAAEALIEYGIKPDMIIGDLDSLPTDIKTQYSDRIIHDPDQETNDLTKAVNACCDRGHTDLTILGATGKREDHTIGNLALLAQYHQKANVNMVTNHGTFHVVDQKATLTTVPGQQVSLFSLTNETVVSATHLKYPVHNLALHTLWQGTLNEATANTITLTAPNAILLVYLLFPPSR